MTGSEITLLIVDDEETISFLLKDFFEDMGFIVTTVNTGADAISVLTNTIFNAAIIDMRLPDMTGNELIIRAHALRPDTKYFVHTGSLDYHLPDELRKLGLSERMILHKPISDMMKIYSIIKDQLGENASATS